MNQYERFAAQKEKQNYKQLLDEQIQVKNHFKMYGNMTSVEKGMNKQDLRAYKNYDNNQYSLIPGMNSHKKAYNPYGKGAVKNPSATDVTAAPASSAQGGNIISGSPQ